MCESLRMHSVYIRDVDAVQESEVELRKSRKRLMEKTKARLDDAREKQKVRGRCILIGTEFNPHPTPTACHGCFRTREALQSTHPYTVDTLSNGFQLSMLLVCSPLRVIRSCFMFLSLPY